MAKVFNVTAVCLPELHYMVNIDGRLAQIKQMIDDRKYFTINRARQYGKTTTLMALQRVLQKDYYVISLDFQMFGYAEFENEQTFAVSFGDSFLRALKYNRPAQSNSFKEAVVQLQKNVEERRTGFALKQLFENLSDICAASEKQIVLMIDEVDSASNNQVFVDFLAQLRAYYIRRSIEPTFQAVILAGVYDVKNLKRKLRPEDEHKVNSPWNIAADFNVEMSFSKTDIGGMLHEYEVDYQTGMDIDEMAVRLFDYTSGYPFLVSRLCQLIDEEVSKNVSYGCKSKAWTKAGLGEAVRMLLAEKNTLFESLTEKLLAYPELNTILQTLLFTGKTVAYNHYEPSINIATMFGFVKNSGGTLAIANRIFDTWLYNFYLSATEMQSEAIYKASLQEKNQFIIDGHLNMRHILEKFVLHFHDLYGNSTETFVEDEGRKYFLLYLRPIINGTGNYYIESRTRDLGRTDIIIDYHGEQYIIEMKIWHGAAYNDRGEKQLRDYLDAYHIDLGYMLSFNFNKKKQIGVQKIILGEKTLIEAVV